MALTKSRSTYPRISTALWVITLIVAGLCGNYFKFPLFLNIDFLFGSIFALLALLFFGYWRGVLAGALIASYTVVIWNHPYSIIIMTAEIAVVGYLVRRRKLGLVLADGLYWLFIGIPLVFLFYSLLMGASQSNVEIIMVKQAINGIANTVVAGLIYSAIVHRTRSHRIKLREVITNQQIAFVLLSSLAALAFNSRQDFAETDSNIRSALIHHEMQLQEYFNTWENNRISSIRHLAGLAAEKTTQEVQFQLEHATRSDNNFLSISLHDKAATSIAFYPLVDKLGISNIGRDFSDRPYIPALNKSLKPMLSDVSLSKASSPTPRVAIMMPILSSRGYNGYVAGILNLELLKASLDTNVKETGLRYTLLDRNNNVIMTNSGNQMMKPFFRGEGTITALDDRVKQWVPPLPGTTPASERWKKSMYFVEHDIGALGEWALILEQPVAPYQRQLYTSYASKLSLLALILLLALGIAEWLSRKTLISLGKLHELSRALPDKVAISGRNITWPKSSLVETQQLIDNYQEVSDSLAQQFDQIREANESLEQRVAERTAALQESESRYERAVNGANDGIWEWVPTTGEYYLSPRWKQLLGYADHELPNVQESYFSNIHPDDMAPVSTAVRAHIEERKPYETELRLRRKNGDYRWFSSRGQASWDEQGQPLNMSGSITDITDRKQADSLLKQSEARFREMFEHNASVMLVIDPASGAIVDANPAAACFYGYPLDQLTSMLISQINTLPPHEIAHRRQWALQAKQNYFVFPHRLASGDVRTVEVRSSSLQVTGRELLFSIIQDVTEHQQSQAQLRLAASVFESSREGIMITEADGTIIDINDAFTHITGYQKQEAIGHNPRILKSGRQSAEFYAAMWDVLKDKGHWSSEIWNRRKNGEVYAEMQTITTVRDPGSSSVRYVALFSDITSIKEHQRQLEHIAHFDALTGLPNRVLLADRLQQSMAQALRRDQELAVAFLDLDGFKLINDSYGHEAGDQLLITLATRMKQGLREGDTLSRIGGDEFVAVLVDLDNTGDSVPMISRLLAAAAEPVLFEGNRLQVSASVGVTFYPQKEEMDADQLQRQADQAMYQAKQSGKNRYQVFDAAHDRSVRGHHESIERIHRALTDHEFRLYYQPKVDMRTGKIIGAEALIRWQHPQNGLLMPAAFLPVIEDHPLIVEIGEWVIDTALSQIETWRAAGLEIPVSVNVSARQLQQSDFVARLQAQLATHPDIHPNDLEIEVLETSALDDLFRVSLVIQECSKIGISFALDDFGTGYSSLTYLKRLAVAMLKIDQSFVRDMLDDPEDLAILEGVIGLAGAFRRGVIAEGVETAEHGEMLLQLGCNLAQGYEIANPMPADQIPDWAATWQPPVSWTTISKISHKDLPLLYAVVEHRAWIRALKSYLEGQQDAPPPMDHHQCRFGALIDRMRMTGPVALERFNPIGSLHRQIHYLAAECCELHESGHAEESLARMDELFDLRDTLIGQLKLLLK